MILLGGEKKSTGLLLILMHRATFCDKKKCHLVMPKKALMEYQVAFLYRKVVRYWKSLPREVIELPSLEAFKRCVDVSIREMA